MKRVIMTPRMKPVVNVHSGSHAGRSVMVWVLLLVGRVASMSGINTVNIAKYKWYWKNML